MDFKSEILCLVLFALLLLSTPSTGLTKDEEHGLRELLEQWPILAAHGWQNETLESCPRDWDFVDCFEDHVTSLIIDNVQLNGHLPDAISRLSYLNKLSLTRTSLSGTIPLSMGDLHSLSSLVLSKNNLAGPIPDSVGNLNSLTLLSLDRNNFSSTIPTALGNLRNLDQLYLEDSKLIGAIPEELGSLSLLLVLYLDNNQLNGTIPSSLVHLSNLAILSLKSNRLNGTIPESLFELPALASLSLSNNSLSGGWPSGTINAPLNELFVDDNDLRLCPALQLRGGGHLDACNITAQRVSSCGCHADWVKTWCVPSTATSFLPDCIPELPVPLSSPANHLKAFHLIVSALLATFMLISY